jgi:hypothetical protein
LPLKGAVQGSRATRKPRSTVELPGITP